MLRRAGLIVAVSIAVTAAVVAAVAASSTSVVPGAAGRSVFAADGSGGVAAGVRASSRAVRGEQVQLSRPPSTPGCVRVAIIGDSLTSNGLWWHLQELDGAGFVSHVDAQPSRRISASVRAPYSGVTAARNVRATWGEADCWVIALGSNDLIFGAGASSVATALIDEQLRAVTPGARVWWVNVDYHRDPAVAFDFVGATATFNRALSQRARTDPQLEVLDWYSLAEANRQWFFDPVHVDRAGSIARATFVVSALPR